METAKMNNMDRQTVSSCLLILGCFGCVLSTTLAGLDWELDLLHVFPTERKPFAFKCLNKSYLIKSDSVSEKNSANDSILLM